MPNARFAIINAIDTAVLDITSEVVGMGIDQVKVLSRDAIYRSVDDNTQVMTGHWDGNGFRLGMLQVFGHNMHGADFRLQLYSDMDLTVQVFDSGVLLIPGAIPLGLFDWGVDPLSIEYQDLHVRKSPLSYWFTPTATAGFKLTLSAAPGFGDTWREMSRVWLSPYYELSANPDYGMGLSVGDNTSTSRSGGGSLGSDMGEDWRKLDMSLASMTEVDRAKVLDFMRYCKKGRDLVVSVFPEDAGRRERDYTINGKFSNLDALKYGQGFHTGSISIEEL